MAACLPALFLSAATLAAGSSARQSSGEEFFIVSSVDAVTSTMVLKRPTEVTLSLRFTEKTRCRTEQGKPIRPSDLRAGDTLFIASERDPSGQLVATSIRQGVMTLQELRRRYLRF